MVRRSKERRGFIRGTFQNIEKDIEYNEKEKKQSLSSSIPSGLDSNLIFLKFKNKLKSQGHVHQ